MTAVQQPVEQDNERVMKRAQKDAIRDAVLQQEREREKLDAPISQQQLEADTAIGENTVGEETGTAVGTDTPTRQEVREARNEKVTKLRGRPSGYSEEEADMICAWIADGKSLRSYCREHARETVTVYRWLREEKEFARRYARAHDDRADSLADEIVDIADESVGGTSDDIQAARLRIDARKWVSAKLKPQKWGDKVEIEQKGHVTFNLGNLRRPPIDVTPAPHSLPTTIDVEPKLVQG